MALNPITAAKIDHGLAALQLDQLTGKAPSTASLAEIAKRAGVSVATVRQVERLALAKVAKALAADPDVPAPLAAALLKSISNPKS